MNYSLEVLLGTLLAALGMIYGLVAWYAVQTRKRNRPVAPINAAPITILIPLCGADSQLYECLRSCCEQDYPTFQILFGVRDELDPAVAVARRLQNDYPHIDMQVVIDQRQWGSNRKVSNLANMLPHARHEHLVITDSDVRFKREHLASLIDPLCDPGVGVVTCAYRGIPRRGLWSLLGSTFINDWFIPSVRVAALTGSREFAFGVTIGIRRHVLQSIGGFESIANQLADDYRLGELTRRCGLRTVLSDVVADTCVDERGVGELIRHELRWLRTIRAVRPWGYAFAGLTFSLPLTALGAALAGGTRPVLIMLAVAIAARIMLHCANRGLRHALPALWAIPLSDALAFALWCWGFLSRRVYWRQNRYWIAYDGSVQPAPFNEAQAVSEPVP